MAPAKKQSTPDSEEHQARMSFGEHLEELRKRVLRALFGSIFAIVVCMYFCNEIVELLLRPYRLALRAHHYPQAFLYNKPPEIIMNYITVGLEAGLIISSPWIIYQLWQFIAAGLFARERKIVYKYIGPSALLFLIGVAFFYVIVLPLTLSVFIGFTDNTATTMPSPTRFEQIIGLGDDADSTSMWQRLRAWISGAAPPKSAAPYPAGDKVKMPAFPMVSSDPPAPPHGEMYIYYNTTEEMLKYRTATEMGAALVIHGGSLFINQPRFDDYLNFVLFMALLFGAAFEMPMVIVVLAQIGLVMPKTFRSVRKYAYFILAAVAAIAAPSGDPMSMACLALPLIGLYEVGIFAAAIIVRRKAAEPGL